MCSCQFLGRVASVTTPPRLRSLFSCSFTPFAPVSFPFPLLARDLPIRWAELGTVYRYERSGTLHGLMRVRGFTQDDAHIFCLPEQLEDEIVSVLDLTEDILSRFGFDR